MDAPGFNGKAMILVVDDMPDNLALMSVLLKDDYKVKIANSGEKALKIAMSDELPDLVLLDIMMPGMDGYEVCRQLKLDSRTANIPVIFITAKVEEEDERKGLELGAIDYITKPISPPIVMARVKNYLALKAMADFLRDQNDWDSAERLAFTLKGFSGNVGVTGLQQLAEKLDIAIKARRSGEDGDDWLDGQTLIAQVTREMSDKEGKEGKAAIKVDQGMLKTVCDKLESLLTNDDAEANDVLDANGELLDAAFPKHYRIINDAIRSFNFEAALVALRDAVGTIS